MIDGTQVIDFHGHVGRWDPLGMKDDPDLMLHAMDSAGIDKSCLFNIFHPDGTTGNDLLARFVAQYPDRFIGFAYVSPMMPERMIPELTRAIDELKFPAIKLYPPYTPWPFNQPQWHPIYEFADERGLAVLFHTNGGVLSRPRYLAEIAPRYPNAKFVAGHSGNTAEPRAEAIAAAQAHPNVYLETCSTYRTPGVIEQLVNEAGADRVLFGSDTTLMDPRPQLGKIITARISDDAKRQILGGNARRLLGL
ncbi:MAG: amidohydrolase family protein [Candidatus Poribacteria bacterium]|nr:amidohydrolase family protein [Candidatus Poribacteria bacterium]